MILKVKSTKIWDYQVNPDYIQHKLVELEHSSRRNNLRTDGIEEEEGKTWEISEAKATKVFKEKLGFDKDIMIERAHRTKRNYKDKDKKRPRTIVLRLANFKDKSIILKNVNKLKGSDVYINEDFSSCVQRVNLLALIIVQLLLGIKGKNNLTKLLASIF